MNQTLPYYQYLAYIAIDKQVAAVEISVYDARLMCMQIIQTFQDLFGPFLECLH